MLTKEELNKFASYLEQLAQEALEQQLNNLPGQEVLARQMRIEEMSARIILKRLRSTEVD